MRRASPIAAPGRSSARRTLRAATAGVHTEVDARFSDPFETDKNAHEASLLAVASRVPALDRDLDILGVSGSGPLRLDASPAVAVMPRGVIAGAWEVFGLFTGTKAHG